MAVLEVLSYPNPFLKTIAQPVTDFNNELNLLIQNMIETMYNSRGIGLAATQVGSDQKLFIMDTKFHPDDSESKKEPIVIINPEIIEMSGEIEFEEGCLSVPDVRSLVKRSSHVKLQYQALDQKTHILEAEGLMAVCIQHEFDHLNGKLFIERLPKLNRKMVITKLKKQMAKQ